MPLATHGRRLFSALSLMSFAAAAFAQAPAPPSPGTSPPAAAAPAAPAAPASPPSPVQGMRSKISAGDLLSAESILEVHRDKYGEDGPYLVGLSWLARGALLTGDYAKAKRYAAAVRARAADSLKRGAVLDSVPHLQTALGAAVEVEAQLIAREKNAAKAADYVRSELAPIAGPVSLRSRLIKRANMLTLPGTPAPELEIDDFLGTQPPTLASLRGKPVVLFLFAEWCGDCRAQAASIARTMKRHAGEDVEWMAVTRYFDKTDAERIREKARVDSVWKADYSAVGDVPLVFSTKSMERYGVSSTPTFVFVDRKGIVRRYTPTRLTDEEFDRTLASLH